MCRYAQKVMFLNPLFHEVGGQVAKTFARNGMKYVDLHRKFMFLTSHLHKGGSRVKYQNNFCYELHEMCKSTKKHYVHNPTPMGWASSTQRRIYCKELHYMCRSTQKNHVCDLPHPWGGRSGTKIILQELLDTCGSVKKNYVSNPHLILQPPKVGLET